jgi:acetyl esterase/lipase
VDIFEPEKLEHSISVFFIHGGGWHGGARQGEHKLMYELARNGIASASTDYRLEGQNSNVSAFDQLNDCRIGYDLFVSHLKELGRKPKIMVFGSSAGSHLAQLLCYTKPGECGEPTEPLENDWQAPAGGIFQASPVYFEEWEGILPSIWSSMINAAGCKYKDSPATYKKLAPFTYLSGNLPPAFYMNSANEHMFPNEYVEKFCSEVNALGGHAEHKTYKHAEHGFFYDVARKVQKEAFNDFLNFLYFLEKKA